jgi:hypothetical protein
VTAAAETLRLGAVKVAHDPRNEGERPRSSFRGPRPMNHPGNSGTLQRVNACRDPSESESTATGQSQTRGTQRCRRIDSESGHPHHRLGLQKFVHKKLAGQVDWDHFKLRAALVLKAAT